MIRSEDRIIFIPEGVNTDLVIEVIEKHFNELCWEFIDGEIKPKYERSYNIASMEYDNEDFYRLEIEQDETSQITDYKLVQINENDVEIERDKAIEEIDEYTRARNQEKGAKLFEGRKLTDGFIDYLTSKIV